MGKHAEWRKIAKKARRKGLRQAIAKDRDQKLLEEQQRLENSNGYRKWQEKQDIMQKENEEEEARQAVQREEQWKKIEVEAQRQWQKLQEKIALARDEKIKQNMKIKVEWEKEQQRLKELQETKEIELEEKRNLQKQRENELLDFLEQGGDTPEHLKTTMETNPGKQICPFFQKVSACRFFDGCSRNHARPGISRTLLFSNFFSDISLETKENEHGSDSNLEFEKEDTYEHYKEFFHDVVVELEKCGKIRNFRTCCNHEAHLRGNVYVEYYSTREALVSYHKFNGRWYAGKRLNVEFCSIESWKNAICGLFHRNRCPKGNACNFLHVFMNPRNLYSCNEEDSARYRRRTMRKSERKSERKRGEDEDSWDRITSEREDWRWSESPEHISRKDDLEELHQSSRSHRENERNSLERKKYRYSRDRAGESLGQSKRKRNIRSGSKHRSSRSRSYRKSTSPQPTRCRSRSSRSKTKSKTPSDQSTETSTSSKFRSSQSTLVQIVVSPEIT